MLLLIRIWLGYKMISVGYSSVVDIIFNPEERAFFEGGLAKNCISRFH